MGMPPLLRLCSPAPCTLEVFESCYASGRMWLLGGGCGCWGADVFAGGCASVLSSALWMALGSRLLLAACPAPASQPVSWSVCQPVSQSVSPPCQSPVRSTQSTQHTPKRLEHKSLIQVKWHTRAPFLSPPPNPSLHLYAAQPNPPPLPLWWRTPHPPGRTDPHSPSHTGGGGPEPSGDVPLAVAHGAVCVGAGPPQGLGAAAGGRLP